MAGVWAVLGLLLVYLSPRATGDDAAPLQCYSCKSMEGLSHSEDCVQYSERTHMQECHPSARYCKKRSLRQSNLTFIERTCERDCLAQTGVYLCPDIHIDVYCCSTDLCNHGNSVTTSWATIAVAVAALWRMLS